MEDVSQLVALEDAKRHLRVTLEDGEVDADVQTCLDTATSIVLSYINTTEHWQAISAAWTEATLPAPVAAAILKQTASLYEFRGDTELKTPALDDDGLAPGVAGYLRRFRDPAVA